MEHRLLFQQAYNGPCETLLDYEVSRGYLLFQSGLLYLASREMQPPIISYFEFLTTAATCEIHPFYPEEINVSVFSF